MTRLNFYFDWIIMSNMTKFLLSNDYIDNVRGGGGGARLSLAITTGQSV